MNSSRKIYFTKDEWMFLVNQITDTVVKHWRYDNKVSFTDEMRNAMDQIFNYYLQRLGEFDSIQSLSRSIIQDINYNIRNIVKQMREKPKLNNVALSTSNVTREHIKDEERKTFNDEFERRKREFDSVNKPENPLVPKPSLEPFDNFGATDINQLNSVSKPSDTTEDDTPLEKRIEDIMREREKDVIKTPTDKNVTGLTLQEKNEIHHVIRNKLNSPVPSKDKKVSFSSNQIISSQKENIQQHKLQNNILPNNELFNERNIQNTLRCTYGNKTTFSVVGFKPTEYGNQVKVQILLPNIKYKLVKCEREPFIDMMICCKTNRNFTAAVKVTDTHTYNSAHLDNINTCIVKIGSSVRETTLQKHMNSFQLGSMYIKNRGSLDFSIYTTDGHCILPPSSMCMINSVSDKLVIDTKRDIDVDNDVVTTLVSSNQDILYTYGYTKVSDTKFEISHKFQTTERKIASNTEYWDVDEMPLVTIKSKTS